MLSIFSCACWLSLSSLGTCLYKSSAPFLVCFLFCFLGLHSRHVEVPKLGVQFELRLQQGRIRAASATYTTGHSNARSSTHWARPGIKPATSWILVRFVSAAPQQELPEGQIWALPSSCSVSFDNHVLVLKVKQLWKPKCPTFRGSPKYLISLSLSLSSHLLFVCLFVFWLHPWHVEVPGPGIKPASQQWPLSHYSHDAGFLTSCATRELLMNHFLPKTPKAKAPKDTYTKRIFLHLDMAKSYYKHKRFYFIIFSF